MSTSSLGTAGMDQHAQIFIEWMSLRYVLVGWVRVVTPNAERVVKVRINRESSIDKLGKSI